MISPFTSPSSERRAVKLAREKLPTTPKKKAQVLEKLLTPKTSKDLERKGVINATQARRKLWMGDALMKSLKTQQICVVSVPPMESFSVAQTNVYYELRL